MADDNKDNETQPFEQGVVAGRTGVSRDANDMNALVARFARLARTMCAAQQLLSEKLRPLLSVQTSAASSRSHRETMNYFSTEYPIRSRRLRAMRPSSFRPTTFCYRSPARPAAP